MQEDEGEDVSEEVMLSQLMTALATGARAVQGLPLEDDFEYQSSFPEVQQLLEDAQGSLLELLVAALESNNHTNNAMSMDDATASFASLDDPLLWEACGDVCDALLEQAAATTSPQLRQELNSAKTHAKKSFGRLISGIVEMEKPQVGIIDGYTIANFSLDRRRPFVPQITQKYHATVPLDLTLQEGHGLDDRFGGLRKASMPNNVVAPDSYVPHPYQTEIQTLEFSEDLYAVPDSKPPPIAVAKELTATWITTPAALQELATKLENCTRIALDLEHHSYRSYCGITCLIQLTFIDDDDNNNNYLIDPFPLWNDLGPALGPIFANPKIVKVLHGADSDMQWLQRDFGLYIVNLFDTGRAARALKLSSAGYAHLLHHYANVTADKTHQLSDWRQRPLPPAMEHYAIMDTHYLIRIVPHLLYDLSKSKTTSIQDAFEDSKKVSLFRYAPEPFKPDGYRALTNRRGGARTELTQTQESVLKALWDWRDQTARSEDESHAYVCTNTQLMRLGMACPTSVGALQNVLQPMPPLILQHSKPLLGIVQRHVNPPSSAFFKPATADRDSPRDNRLLSPVLGTEALYRQAGWISPHHHHHGASEEVVTTTEDDEDDVSMDEGTKPRRVLAVHETNKKYRANQCFSSHSLQLSNPTNNNSSSNATTASTNNKDGSAADGGVDGLGTARAAHPQGVIEDEARLAQTNAERIRTAQKEHGMIGFISPTMTDMEEDDDDDDDVDDADDDEEELGNAAEKSQEQQEQDFVIPRSMREIYRISNRNRRNKKGGGSLSPSGGELNEKEHSELAKADETLKSRNLGEERQNYYDEITGSPKRQRTKSTASMSSEEANPGNDSGSVSREDDIALMQEIGWISGKEEVDGMMKQQQQQQQTTTEDNNDDDNSSDDEAGKSSKPAFDYSNIGAIGALSANPSSNPFFAGAAVAGGHLNQQYGKQHHQQQQQPSEKKKQNQKGKQSRRQVERPERREGRSQVYKKR
jgi:ribonuclease D